MRTVAGRLGHGGGGTTTLRVYAAWVAEADQRAAQGLADRLPPRPDPVVDETERAKTDPRSPYERLAVALHDRIADGSIAVGQQLPTGKELGKEFGVAATTAQRAVVLLRSWGLVRVSRGRRAIVVSRRDEQVSGS